MKTYLMSILIVLSLASTAGTGGTGGGSKGGRPTKTGKRGFFSRIFKPQAKHPLVTQDSTWQEIKNGKGHKSRYLTGDSIFLGSTRMSAFKVCLEDSDTFRSIVKHKIYKDIVIGQTSRGDDKIKRVVDRVDYHRFPLTYTSRKRVCANNDKRCRWEEISHREDPIREIEVIKIIATQGSNDNKSNVTKSLFKKDYEIQDCN